MNGKTDAVTVQDWLKLPNPIQEPGHELIMTVMLVSRMLSNAGRLLLRKSGLTEAQFNILMLLKYQFTDGATQVGLSRCVLVNRANVTGLIDRLERDKLVQRGPQNGDRRIKIVTITPKGLKNLLVAEASYFEGIRKVAEWIPATDQKKTGQTLLHLCKLLSGNIS